MYQKFFVRKKELPIEYVIKSTMNLTEQELNQCSELFSNNYGYYGKEDPKGRAGKPIKMGTGYYKRHYLKPDYYVALAIYQGAIIAQAFYIKKFYKKEGNITWVLQLVVHRKYRKRRIASKLLHSIWGFSNDHAWGLATANPCTVRTLERATFRKANPKTIKKHLDTIKRVGDEINFVCDYVVDDTKSLVNTKFFIDISEKRNEIEENSIDDDWRLGGLEPGYEWLAFTFKGQELSPDSKKYFKEFVSFSESQLKDAYSRMRMKNQPWTKHTSSEVDFIEDFCNLNSSQKILDIGCGFGRHSIEFGKRNYTVTGLDFSEKNIKQAREASSGLDNVSFFCCDCRKIKLTEKFDVALALYDVIGSFPNNTENIKLIKQAYKYLKHGGVFILSVMNMELTQNLANKNRIGDVNNNIKLLLDLKPSNIMQQTGDVFDPEYYVIDSKHHLVYRKEQFENDGNLSAEYVIRDRRYTEKEIREILNKVGFRVCDVRCVSAGHWDQPLKSTHLKAKEILVIARK